MLLISLGFAAPTPALADEISQKVAYSASTSADIIAAYGVHYGVPDSILEGVIQCESQGNSLAIGDHGHSHGLVQISDIYHPEISLVQANDPLFSIDYLASQIAKGKGVMWSCYRKLGYGVIQV